MSSSWAKRLQRVEGVARVEINGLTEREVRIDLDATRLRAYGVTPADIATALREANADQPVGLISDGTQDALLRVEGRVRDPRQFENVVVAHAATACRCACPTWGSWSSARREPESTGPRQRPARPSTSTSSSSRTPTSSPPAKP